MVQEEHVFLPCMEDTGNVPVRTVYIVPFSSLAIYAAKQFLISISFGGYAYVSFSKILYFVDCRPICFLSRCPMMVPCVTGRWFETFFTLIVGNVKNVYF